MLFIEVESFLIELEDVDTALEPDVPLPSDRMDGADPWVTMNNCECSGGAADGM